MDIFVTGFVDGFVVDSVYVFVAGLRGNIWVNTNPFKEYRGRHRVWRAAVNNEPKLRKAADPIGQHLVLIKTD